MEHNAGMRPDVLQPGYDEGSRLTAVAAWLRQQAAPAALLDPATATLLAVTGIGYNARGQRVSIGYGNGVSSACAYDPQTFRLARLTTTRPGPAATVQDLAYYYDPAGNLTRVADNADTHDVIFFRNQRVDPSSDFGYDAVYRLISATGREHLGQAGAALAPPSQVTNDDSARTGLPQPGDGKAMGRYTQTYTYDGAGRLLAMAHQASSGGWTRRYDYARQSQIDPAQTGNRPAATSLPGDPAGGPYSARYQCDEHGNLTAMPHLPVMTWDADDRLRSTARQAPATGTPQTTFYAYGSTGQRLRKVTNAPAAGASTPVRKAERIYLGGIEVYREFAADGTTITLERHTLRIADGTRLVALVETRVSGTSRGPRQQVRYQHGNQLDSALLELSDTAGIISYEEYFPYGATSYQAVAAQTDVPKRYRFTGKERDAESDLYYHGARYYAPWLGLWASCDPLAARDGQTPYCYAACNPVRYADPTGRDPDPPAQDPNSRLPGPLLPGMSSRPGTNYLPPLYPRPAINAPNYYFASMSQGSGVMTSNSIDVESGVLVIVSRTTGLTLRLPATSGGLAAGVIAIRRQIPALPGFDVGVAGAGSYTGQGSTSVTTSAGTPGTDPGTSQGSGTALVTAHYGRQNLGGTPVSAAIYAQGGYQRAGQSGQAPTDAGVFQAMPAFGVEWDPPTQGFRLSDPPVSPYKFYLASVILNPVVSYASRGSLSQGPPLTDVWTAGGIISAGVGWGRPYGLVGEFSLVRNWGSPTAGSDEAARSVAWRAGLIFSHNYLDRTTSGLQTSSIAFGLWYGRESGTITSTARAGAATGNWNSDNWYFGIIFGYRRPPQD
jgi:RHS repeat-associated protein